MLFAVLLTAVDFRSTIDGRDSTVHQINGVDNCCNSTSLLYMYHVSIYDKQNLNPGPHVLDITLLNATGSDVDHIDRSHFYVHYAVVNETGVYTLGSTARNR